MREALSCLLGIFLPLALIAAPAPMNPDKSDPYEKALEKDPRLPVWLWAAGQQAGATDTGLPMIAVGHITQEVKPLRLGEINPWRSLPVLRPGDLLEGYWKGQLVPAPPTHMESVTLFLVGPSLNSGEAWGPARLTRAGTTFTLLLEGWTDDGPRRRNVPSRALYALNLGQLNGGNYDLHIVWRTMLAETGKTAPLSRIQSVKTGQLRFSVSRAITAIPKPGDGLGHLSTLKESGFRAREVAPEDGKRLWQKPVSWERQLDGGGQLRGLPAPGLSVGTFDLVRWLASQPMNLGNLPPLQQPASGQPTYAVILGPTLNTGEWLTLRDIQWQDRQAVIRVDLWRDNEGRRQNITSSPLLIVPLWNPAGLLPGGKYTVKVEWSLLRAVNNREPYHPEDTTRGDAAVLTRLLQQRGKVEFLQK